MQDSKWLVVFDNADLINTLPRFFAKSPSGSVIVTSRDPLARGESFAAKEIKLESFEEAEGVEFILSFLDPSLSQNSVERQSLVKLVDIFAGLPLGLRIAAGIMRSKHYSPSVFLRLCMHTLQDVESVKVLGNPKTLGNLWDVSLGAITDDAKDLLAKITLLEPAMIPFKLFESQETEPSESSLRDVQKFHDALECLTSQSLVNVDQARQSISIHRYLQDVMFRKLVEKDRHDPTVKMTLVLLRNACPPASFQSHASPEQWKVRRQYASHTEFIQKRLGHRIARENLSLLVDLLSDTVL